MKILLSSLSLKILFNEIFRAIIEVFCDAFGGKVFGVWFSYPDINEFINNLEHFEKTRQGSIELFNMSSQGEVNPLKFRIFSTDSLGHLAVQVGLKRILYLSNSTEYLQTLICFDFDPTLLPKIIYEFKRLFQTIEK